MIFLRLVETAVFLTVGLWCATSIIASDLDRVGWRTNVGLVLAALIVLLGAGHLVQVVTG